MPIYTGKSADGSDMRLVEGVYVNPDNDNEWSSEPYPKQRKAINTKNEVLDYMNGRYCLDDVYEQIKNKVCKLPKRVRDYVVSHYTPEGVFIKNNENEKESN
jgi:hypothetical protein